MASNSSLTPIRLKDPSPYLVHDRDEIFLVLTRLAKKPELVCLYANQQSDVFILSALLLVNQNNLIFDLGRNAELNQRLLSAKTICCVAHINSIHYQFDLIVSAATSINEQAAIDCLFPTQMLSLQRRDFYRLSIPLSTPLSCLIPLQQGGDVEISMSDISLGGVGLLGFVPDISLDIGSILHNCRIELPQVGLITADIEICTSNELIMKNGIRTIRSGCRFINLSGSGQTLVQRYINHVERKRLALE